MRKYIRKDIIESQLKTKHPRQNHHTRNSLDETLRDLSSLIEAIDSKEQNVANCKIVMRNIAISLLAKYMDATLLTVCIQAYDSGLTGSSAIDDKETSEIDTRCSAKLSMQQDLPKHLDTSIKTVEMVWEFGVQHRRLLEDLALGYDKKSRPQH